MSKSMSKAGSKRQYVEKDSKPLASRPLTPGKAGHRLLWDSYYRGQYIKKEHGPLV